jgi:succinate dehydrogenase/fumarate reductase cytochrome b subunit
MRVAIVSLFLIALGAWVGYHAINALRCGVANARGVRYARRSQPARFWVTVVVQIALTFGCGYLLYLKLHP